MIRDNILNFRLPTEAKERLKVEARLDGVHVSTFVWKALNFYKESKQFPSDKFPVYKPTMHNKSNE